MSGGIRAEFVNKETGARTSIHIHEWVCWVVLACPFLAIAWWLL